MCECFFGGVRVPSHAAVAGGWIRVCAPLALHAARAEGTGSSVPGVRRKAQVCVCVCVWSVYVCVTACWCGCVYPGVAGNVCGGGSLCCALGLLCGRGNTFAERLLIPMEYAMISLTLPPSHVSSTLATGRTATP